MRSTRLLILQKNPIVVFWVQSCHSLMVIWVNQFFTKQKCSNLRVVDGYSTERVNLWCSPLNSPLSTHSSVEFNHWLIFTQSKYQIDQDKWQRGQWQHTSWMVNSLEEADVLTQIPILFPIERIKECDMAVPNKWCRLFHSWETDAYPIFKIRGGHLIYSPSRQQ